MIEVRNLTKRYGPNTAVDNLSFTVEDNMVYGFLGPNGAGKSTTMNIMTGYLSTTEGDVIINGHSIIDEPEAAKENIGFLPELPPLYTEMTPEEYLRFVAEIKKIPKAKINEELDEAIAKTGLQEYRHRLIKNLSKGYRQRVGFAEAIIGKPPVIILDEPMVGLDPIQIIEMRNLIKELGEEHTVILSSHILSEVSEVCDKIMIIAKGKLVAMGSPTELEQQLGGGKTVLTIKVRGSAAAVAAVIDRFEGITYTIGEDNGETVTLTVEYEPEKDLRDDIYFAFADARLPIVEMQAKTASLEQVFLELAGADEIPESAEGEVTE